MSKKCIYCKVLLDDKIVLDVCKRCGYGVWGEKMYSTIIKNMESARDAGDLYQGSVTENFEKNKADNRFSQTKKDLENSSLVSEAIANIETHPINKDDAEKNSQEVTSQIINSRDKIETVESSYFLNENKSSEVYKNEEPIIDSTKSNDLTDENKINL